MDLPIPKTWTDAAPRLLAVVRRATEPAHAFLAERQAPANRLLRQPFLPMLRTLVMLDLPDVRMFVNHGHLDLWGIDEDTALAAAIDNLRDVATDGLGFHEALGLWQVDASDGCASSRLLLPGWLGAFEGRVPGRPIAAIPGARILLIGGDEDARLSEVLQQTAERGFHRAGHALSPVVYTVDDAGRTVPWRPADPDLATRMIGAQKQLDVHEYTAQAEQLVALDDLDATIAPITLEASDAGETLTVARWDRSDARTLLPLVDQVQCIEGETVQTVGWQTLQPLQPADFDPPRFIAPSA